MTTPEKGNYGFGMGVSEHFRQTTQKVFEHGGGINGFTTSMKWFPDADLFVAAFANSDSARTGEVAENLAAIMFDLPTILPKERKAIKLKASQLKPLVGRYELAPDFILTVTASDEQLFVQGTGQSRAEVFPESSTNFFAKVVDAKLTFYKDTAGKVTHIVLHQNGDHEAKRLKD
jgi:hypothetical protein